MLYKHGTSVDNEKPESSACQEPPTFLPLAKGFARKLAVACPLRNICSSSCSATFLKEEPILGHFHKHIEFESRIHVPFFIIYFNEYFSKLSISKLTASKYVCYDITHQSYQP
ncbi:hypothetical protein V6N13_018525 [Hibiscus sabdariffa]